MERKDLEQVVRTSAAKVMQVEPDSLFMQMRWVENLKAKSMHIFMIAALLEDAVDLKIPMARVFENKTIGDTVDLLEELITARGSAARAF